MDKVEIDNLSFRYDKDDYVLSNINLTVLPGEFVCILGQSGCGKSTLLRLLGGFERPSEGRITVNDIKVLAPSLERSIVFQDYGLFPWMTAGDNILLNLKQKYGKKPKSELKQIAFAMLKEVGLEEQVFYKLPNQLSGGMKQRCAIAQAFSINPPCLLMDEPFGALDAVTRSRLQKLVLNLWKSDEDKKTVFFVTHDVEEAIFLATRIIVLGQKPSRIIADKQIHKPENFSMENQFEDRKIIALRNELIKLINSDIESHI